MQPEDADTLHRLGVSSYERGSFQEAVELITRSVAIRPSDPKAYNDLGNALGALGRPAEAVAAFRQAIAIEPDYIEAHNNLGNAMGALDRPAEAEASYREALRLRPDVAEVHNNLGAVLLTLGRPAEAVASCRESLRLRPQSPQAHSNLGNALRDLGHPAEAVASCREALRLRPDFPEAYNNLGNALSELGRPATAEASYREALRLRPDYSEAHTNLGAALCDLRRPAEAAASCREALRRRPELPEAHNNLSYALLLAGRLEEGWKEYEWRWRTKHLAGDTRGFSAPMWRGEPIGNRVILLHAEQGLGDTLQFCRYVPLLAPGARVILEVQAPLVRLLSRLPGIRAIVARGDKLPSFDLHCPLMSLPLAFGTTLDTIPAATPYLAAEGALAAAWRDRLAGLDGLRVGLVWAGGQRLDQPAMAVLDRRRSIPLDMMGPLGEIPGISFISLQKGEPSSQAANPPRGMALYDFTAALHDFADTAALVDSLDLVITVDTAVGHLAGALGKPVWLLNRFDGCWRWLLNRDDSPWYPQLRQFRQPGPGDWRPVIRSMRDALERLAAGDRDQLRPRRAVG